MPTKSVGKLAPGAKRKSSCNELLEIHRADALYAPAIGHTSKRMGSKAHGHASIQYNHGGRGGVLIGVHLIECACLL